MTTKTGDQTLVAASAYRERIVRFLREMIAIPAESRREKERCERVFAEYESLGFDEVLFDGLGTDRTSCWSTVMSTVWAWETARRGRSTRSRGRSRTARSGDEAPSTSSLVSRARRTGRGCSWIAGSRKT